MGWVHNFIRKSLVGNNEIKKIYLKQDMQKQTSLTGLCLFDQNIIFVAKDNEQDDIQIAILHEIFHYYFRDYRDKRPETKIKYDPVEERAENSAKRMLQWYKENKKEYMEFNKLVGELKTSVLSKEELEDIV